MCRDSPGYALPWHALQVLSMSEKLGHICNIFQLVPCSSHWQSPNYRFLCARITCLCFQTLDHSYHSCRLLQVKGCVGGKVSEEITWRGWMGWWTSWSWWRTESSGTWGSSMWWVTMWDSKSLFVPGLNPQRTHWTILVPSRILLLVELSSLWTVELSFLATGVVFVVMEVEISYTAESLTTKYTMKRGLWAKMEGNQRDGKRIFQVRKFRMRNCKSMLDISGHWHMKGFTLFYTFKYFSLNFFLSTFESKLWNCMTFSPSLCQLPSFTNLLLWSLRRGANHGRLDKA